MNQNPKTSITEKTAFRVVGLRYEGKNEHGEVPALWDLFIPRINEVVDDPKHWIGYGIARALPGIDASEKWEYLAGVEVSPGKKIPEDMVIWEIPASTYAVVPAHDMPGIGPANDYFYNEWLPNSQEWKSGEPFMFEMYPESFGQDLILYLYFPIKRKS